MKARRKTLLALVGAMAVGAAVAAPSVEITSVQQQYPWTNTVDIVYTVAGVESETNGYFVVFTPTTSTGEPILDVNGETSVQVALTGSGPFTTQWFPQTNQQYTACKMTPSVFRGAVKDYMIVDLLTGAVTYEPMATQEASNQRYNTAEYKTTKMVFRRIEAGDYKVGAGTVANVAVNMAKPYYIGVFPVTEVQYNLMSDAKASTTPTQTNMRPWIGFSRTIRGNALVRAIPSSGAIGSLNQRVASVSGPGVYQFDLPTEAMWEVAARARTTTSWFFGSTSSQLGSYAWCNNSNADDGYGNTSKYRVVGTKLPNPWGLFDMYGNGANICRDNLTGSTGLYDIPTAGLGQAPVVNGNSNQFVLRGGIYSESSTCSSNYRDYQQVSQYACRLAVIVE